MDFVDACKEFIAIDSSPTNGTGEICQFVETLALNLGFYVHRDDNVQRGIEQANVICSTRPVEVHTDLILQTHLDTVDPGSFALWDKTGRNPFHASIHQGKIFGLGAVRTKLDFLCKLYAAKNFLKMEPKKSFAVVGTYGAEAAMQGAIHLIRHKILKPKMALIGEPTNFDVTYAGKGMANVEITIPFTEEERECRIHHDTGESQSTQSKIFRGVAAHSALPDKGVNALEKLFDFLRQLPDQLLLLDIDGGTNHNTIPTQAVLEFDIYPLREKSLNQKIVNIFEMIKVLQSDFNKFPDPDFHPPTTTFNIGMARTFSDHFKLMGCVNWPAAIDEDIYRQWMEKLETQCKNVGASFQVRDFKKPFHTAKEGEFSRAVLEVVQSVNPDSNLTTQPVTNEANVFSKFNVESLVFGPGVRDENAHTPEESIAMEDLEKAVQIYQKIIEKLCFNKS